MMQCQRLGDCFFYNPARSLAISYLREINKMAHGFSTVETLQMRSPAGVGKSTFSDWGVLYISLDFSTVTEENMFFEVTQRASAKS